jgi:hypothetical protein
MNGLRMVWYSSGDSLICRWVDAEELENQQTVPTPISSANASPATQVAAAAAPGRTEFAARRAA